MVLEHPSAQVGVRKIYEAIFGVKGETVDPKKAIFPKGPPTGTPKISSTLKVSSR
ncbi:MAG: hypothetical protein WDO06_06470 [Actinomycetota bacterium]